MIHSKEEYKEYLQADKRALGITRKRPKFFADEIWKFERALRKYEYYHNLNIGKNPLFLIAKIFAHARYHHLSVKLGFSIPINVFNKGLSIAHYGSIVVNSKAVIGENCRIQENVTIGATGGSIKAPQLGNNIFIGSGARIIGDITVADNIAIGANAVVTKSFTENDITLGGDLLRKLAIIIPRSLLKQYKFLEYIIN